MSDLTALPHSKPETRPDQAAPHSVPDEASHLQHTAERAAKTPREAAKPAGASRGPETHFWLRRSDQLFVGVMVSAGLVLMAWHWARLSGWGMQPVEIDRHAPQWLEYRIDINTATWVEWAQLPGIGETLYASQVCQITCEIRMGDTFCSEAA